MKSDQESPIGPTPAPAPSVPAPPVEAEPSPPAAVYTGPERRAVGYLVAELLTPQEAPEGLPSRADSER